MSQPYNPAKMDSAVDYNYFSAAPMPYTFFGLPPTPQSHTPRGDDYKNFQAHNVSLPPSQTASLPMLTPVLGTLRPWLRCLSAEFPL